MKHLFARMMLTAALVLHSGAADEPGQRLLVTIAPRFGDKPLAFDACTHRTTAGQMISVTRLDFLLSNIALRGADGGWLGLTNWFAYLSLREGRAGFELNNIPAGDYDRLRFQVGVPPSMNHADPAQFDSTHPLNPNVNGLHWNWQGGYVFFALEGNWRGDVPLSHAGSEGEGQGGGAGGNLRPTIDESLGGYSYHLATDPQLMTAELPLSLNLRQDLRLTLALNVEKIFAARHTITLRDDTTSTHSRPGDELADQLRANIEGAFAIDRITPEPPVIARRRPSDKVEVASTATPRHLAFTRFFPPPALPEDNPLTEEGVRLGALLFFDPRLSVNRSQSCGSCHHPKAAFTEAKPTSIGAEGQVGARNAMPLFNLAWKSSFFWDGRASSLREQVLQPIQNPIEMHETLENVVAKIRLSPVNARHQERAFAAMMRSPRAESDPVNSDSSSTTGRPSYSRLFADAFGTPAVTADRIARALEQFLITQVSHHSKFDRFVAGEAELTAEEQRGFKLFHTEYDPRRGQFGADCFHCHGGPLFQSQSFANNGLDSEFTDPGRYLVTMRDGDRGKFAVPSLRNVELTAPYMHDGRFATLEEVIEHYRSGVRRSPTLDPNLAKHPAGGIPLSAADQRSLAAFLRTLSDSRP